MLNDFIDTTVNSVINSIDFEKVSDLSKEQLAEIISKSIYKTITSSDFTDKISNELALRIRRMR